MNKKLELLLIGAGGHCRSCIELISSLTDYRITGVVDQDGSDLKDVLGHNVVGTDSNLEALISDNPKVLITVGQIKTPEIRINLYNKAKSYGAEFPVLVSPNAYLSQTAKIEEGSVLLHLTMVNSSARVGKNCIINSQALVEHDASIGAHCHLSTGSKINGDAHVEFGSFIGSGAVVHHGKRIQRRCIVGAGAVVAKNLAEGTTLQGSL